MSEQVNRDSLPAAKVSYYATTDRRTLTIETQREHTTMTRTTTWTVTKQTKRLGELAAWQALLATTATRGQATHAPVFDSLEISLEIEDSKHSFLEVQNPRDMTDLDRAVTLGQLLTVSAQLHDIAKAEQPEERGIRAHVTGLLRAIVLPRVPAGWQYVGSQCNPARTS